MAHSTTFALCQSEPSAPPVDLLSAAFGEASGLTAMDAQLAVRQGCGILADRLDHERALTIRDHLARHGYRCDVVPEGELELPRATHVRRADVSPSALVVFDVYGRPSEIAWTAFTVVHAGTYPEGELVTTKEAGWEFRGEMTIAWDAEHDYIETDALTLELIARARRARYAIAPSPFDYRYLAERKRGDSRENFAVLLDDVTRQVYASLPWLAFRSPGDAVDLEKLRRYPSRRLFERHLSWLMWYASSKRLEPGSPNG